MSAFLNLAPGKPDGSLLWIDIMHQLEPSLVSSLDSAFETRLLNAPLKRFNAMDVHAPRFVCLELDKNERAESEAIQSLLRECREHSCLPVLVIAGRDLMSVALWAVRLRAWHLPLKQNGGEELPARSVARAPSVHEPRNDALYVRDPAPASALQAIRRQNDIRRTAPAIAHVAAHFDRKATLEDMAHMCKLSPSQFCRTFRNAHSVSFGRYLLRFRMERARERLVMPGALIKEVAYEAGFNDMSYFARSFRREWGVSPSAYQAAATARCADIAPACV